MKIYDCDNNNDVDDDDDDDDDGNDVFDDIIASGIHLPYYRFTPIFHLSALLTNTKAMSFQKHIEHMHQKIQEHNEKLKPLKEMELFVLDNSLRESTVAQLRGHTIENKWKIYEEVSHVIFLMGTK